ncbi:hypothetical protein HK102_007422 [Quaeritorhiza haematococci]|nr:hypothetical protein HK102_007422 [Quaeritorhiza haematococci]
MTVQLSRSFSSPSSSSTTPPLNPEYTEGERDIHLKLVKAFEPASLMVKDISGGCGSMYAVDIASKKFKGLNLVKQHRLVTEVLKEDIKDMHGIQIKTTAA